MSRPKVYVVQRPAHRDRNTREWVEGDLTPAEHYGEVVVLLPPGNLPRDASVGFSALTRGLKDFDAERDMLLLAGDPVAIAMASAMVSRKSGGRLRLLKWDRIHHCYLLSELTLPNEG